MKILIAYDGTIHARKALTYGIEKVREAGGEITLLQVFDRSLFVDYDAGPGAEDLARREAAGLLEEAKRIIAEKAEGLAVKVITMDGDAAGALASAAGNAAFDLVMAPPRFKAAAKALALPVFLVPGTILVPVDGSGSLIDESAIMREAKAIGAKVLVLGIVPEHLFSREETSELEAVKRATGEAAKRLRRSLADQGVEATSIVRSGYPDEEILSAANDHAVSLILLPAGGVVPSELSKAAAILLDEPERLRWPVFVTNIGLIS